MGHLLRLLAAGAILAAVTPVGSAAAQAGAGQGLSSPTGEQPAPAEAAPPPRTEGAAPARTGEPTYVPVPPGYGTGYGGPAYAGERAAPRSTVDRTPKHVGNIMSIMGAAAFANAYLTVAFVGAYGSADWLLVPVIGPFAAIAEDGSFDDPLIWIDGVVQLVGAAALAVGLGLRFSFDDSPDAEGEAQLTPWLGPGSGGLGLSGTF